MGETKKTVEVFFDDLKDYLNTRVDLASLIATDKASSALSTLITKGALVVVFMFGLFFGSIALSIYIGLKVDNYLAGFLWVCGGYMLIGVFLIIVKDSWLKKPILNSFTKEFFRDEK